MYYHVTDSYQIKSGKVGRRPHEEVCIPVEFPSLLYLHAMLTFECLRCGKCCMSITERIYHIPMGLALFPDEVELFANADVRPFIGVENGTGIVPVWFQMIKAPCPYYNHERFECTIYRKRPVVCRAYPFKVVLNYTRFGRCTWLAKQTPKRSIMLLPEIMKANRTIAAYDRTIFSPVKREQIRLYNAETNEWIAVPDLAHTETAAEFNPPALGIMSSEWNNGWRCKKN